MPITSTIEAEHNLIVHRCEGKLSVKDFVDAFDTVMQLEGYQTGMNVLWDVRLMTIKTHFENVQQLVSHVSFERKSRGTGYRLAVISNSAMQKMMASIFKALASPLSFTISMFSNEADARSWLENN